MSRKDIVSSIFFHITFNCSLGFEKPDSQIYPCTWKSIWKKYHGVL